MTPKSKKKVTKRNDEKLGSANEDYDFNTEFYKTFFQTVETYKDYYYILDLRSNNGAELIVDDDPLIECDFISNRYIFLEHCINNSLEFNSPRRAVYSTKMVIFQIMKSRKICIDCGTSYELEVS